MQNLTGVRMFDIMQQTIFGGIKMAKQDSESKKEKKQRIAEIKEQFRAVHRGMREDELKEHNGKPFTSKNLPELKNKYNRKRMKNARDEY